MEKKLKEQRSVLSTEQEGKYLTFWTDGQLFGIPVSEVIQIVGVQDIIHMPDYPVYIKGVICLRGSVIPLMDVRLRLGRAEAAYTDRTCIIITTVFSHSVGLIVDGVDEVTYIEKEQITEPPQAGGAVKNECLTGVAAIKEVKDDTEKIILCTNAARLLGESVLSALSVSC